MEKINGYTKEEAQSLVKYVCEGRGQGKTLTRIFDEYARNTGRARGSVRNYYYALLKSTNNEEVRNMLQGTDLKAEEVRPFTDEETDKILKAILQEKSKGISVRRAVLTLAGGDDKLMLRYQNKYRNVMAKQPERIERLMREAGYSLSDGGRKAIEEKINTLYDELNASLKEENKRLTQIIKRLTDENYLLKLQVKNLQN
ncbi:MAG: hypothetical protein K2N14_05050 [Clostridia bacterium]|nr:hypothetical protein [Clostridia bacterium]